MHFVDAKGILSAQNGMNLYRGCTHGCIYCDTRSTCYGFDHAFEDICVKQNAPDLLRKALKSKRRRCMIGTGAMCDPYLPLEESLGLTRKCLEIIAEEEFGLSIQTKSNLILRDLDLLQEINKKAKCVVSMTMTTYDETLCQVLEPNVCTTRERFEVLKTLRDADIPTVVWLTPILPHINDTHDNLYGLLEYCKEANVWGIICYGMGLTLREGNREYFYAALDHNFPGLKEQYQAEFGDAYVVMSSRNATLMRAFYRYCHQNKIVSDAKVVFSYLQEFPQTEVQLSLF